MRHPYLLLCFFFALAVTSTGCTSDKQAQQHDTIEGLGDAGTDAAVIAVLEIESQPAVPDTDAADAEDAASKPVEPAAEPEAQCAPELCKTGTALPGDQSFAADGLCARTVASGQGALQKLVFAPNGYLMGIKASGEIYRYFDWSCNGEFEDNEMEQFQWASSGGNGDDLAFDVGAGYLYATSPSGVVRWRFCGDIYGGGLPLPVVEGQPTESGRSDLHLDEDWLYVKWSPAQAAATIKRFALAELDPEAAFDWADGEVITLDANDVDVFADDVEELPSWSWQAGDATSDVEITGAATSPLDGALYVTASTCDESGATQGAIYRIANAP